MKKLAVALMAFFCVFSLCFTAGAQGTKKKVSFTYSTFIGRETDMVGATVDAYMKKYSNINIDYQIVDHASMQEKYGIMVQSNSMPDMFWWNGAQLVDALNNSKALLDLTPYYDAAFKKTFVAGAFEQLTTKDGKIAGFPADMQVQAWMMNKALFAKYGLKIPTTYDQLKACVPVFKKNGIATIAYGSGNNWPVWNYEQWLVLWGIYEQGDAVFKDHSMKAVDADFKNAYAALAELRKLGAFPEENTTMNFDQMCALFNAGKAAMISLPSDQLAKVIGQPLEKDYVFTWGISFPASKYPQNKVIRAVANGYGVGSGVARDKDKLDAILAFNKWRYSSEGFQLALKVGAILPVSVKYDASKLGQVMKEQVKLIQDNKVVGVMNSDWVPLSKWGFNNDLWFQGWGTLKFNLENSLMNGSMTADDIPVELAKVDEGIDAVLAQLK
jgi:raffinose/stachyose/melibiose transport system substrate-binding protein